MGFHSNQSKLPSQSVAHWLRPSGLWNLVVPLLTLAAALLAPPAWGDEAAQRQFCGRESKEAGASYESGLAAGSSGNAYILSLGILDPIGNPEEKFNKNPACQASAHQTCCLMGFLDGQTRLEKAIEENQLEKLPKNCREQFWQGTSVAAQVCRDYGIEVPILEELKSAGEKIWCNQDKIRDRDLLEQEMRVYNVLASMTEKQLNCDGHADLFSLTTEKPSSGAEFTGTPKFSILRTSNPLGAQVFEFPRLELEKPSLNCGTRPALFSPPLSSALLGTEGMSYIASPKDLFQEFLGRQQLEGYREQIQKAKERLKVLENETCDNAHMTPTPTEAAQGCFAAGFSRGIGWIPGCPRAILQKELKTPEQRAQSERLENFYFGPRTSGTSAQDSKNSNASGSAIIRSKRK